MLDAGDILRYLPPLDNNLGQVSRLLYLLVRKSRDNPAYWKMRGDDAPALPTGDAYITYHIIKQNISLPSPNDLQSFQLDSMIASLPTVLPVMWNDLSRLPPASISATRTSIVQCIYRLIGVMIYNDVPLEEVDSVVKLIRPYKEQELLHRQVWYITGSSRTRESIALYLHETHNLAVYQYLTTSLPEFELVMLPISNGLDAVLEYSSWLLSIGYDPDGRTKRGILVFNESLHSVKKGSTFELPVVEKMLLCLPVHSLKSSATRLNALSGYIANATDINDAIRRFKYWGFVGIYAYMLIEEAVEKKNYLLAKALLDDLPSRHEDSASNANKIRVILDNLEEDPNLTGYPSLRQQVRYWKVK